MLKHVDMLFPLRIKVVHRHQQPRRATFQKSLPTLCAWAFQETLQLMHRTIAAHRPASLQNIFVH
jgi:hypothetical protein